MMLEMSWSLQCTESFDSRYTLPLNLFLFSFNLVFTSPKRLLTFTDFIIP